VSVLGIGCGYLASVDREEGTRLLERAFELGINYFDGRYGDSSFKLRPLLVRHRDRCVIVTKTRETTAKGAVRRIDEDLTELGTDYIDIFLLRTYNREMLGKHFAPRGSMEGLQRAREMGKIRFIGMSDHSDLTVLAEAIETDLVDVVLFPLNVVRREALEQVIPTGQKHDVGLTVMKPVSMGTIPPEVALPWLANQPIHTMVPGMTTIEHLERDVAAVERDPMALSPEEEAEAERWRQKLDQETCHICDEICQPCEAGLRISMMIHHDVSYNHYRNMGLEAFLDHPWAPWFKKRVESHFARRLSMLQSCTRCGLCEERCPYHLPIMGMLERMLEDHLPLIEAVKERGWSSEYEDAKSPY